MNTVLILIMLACAPELEISTEAGAVQRIALAPEGRFSVSYWHSMYNVPFTEDFRVNPARDIQLVTVRSDHGGVLDYLRLEGEPGTPQSIERHFPSITFGIAVNNPQTLIVGAQRWSFREFGGPGDKVVFTPGADCGQK